MNGGQRKNNIVLPRSDVLLSGGQAVCRCATRGTDFNVP